MPNLITCPRALAASIRLRIGNRFNTCRTICDEEGDNPSLAKVSTNRSTHVTWLVLTWLKYEPPAGKWASSFRFSAGSAAWQCPCRRGTAYLHASSWWPGCAIIYIFTYFNSPNHYCMHSHAGQLKPRWAMQTPMAEHGAWMKTHNNATISPVSARLAINWRNQPGRRMSSECLAGGRWAQTPRAPRRGRSAWPELRPNTRRTAYVSARRYTFWHACMHACMHACLHA